MTDLQPIAAGITGQQAAEIIFNNDTALLNGQLFNPAMSEGEYASKVSAGAAGAGQTAQVNADGKAELYTAAGSNPDSGTVGLRGYFLEAGFQYLFKAIFKFTGFVNPVAENAEYFIYYEGATRKIEGLSALTDLGGGRYLWERTLSPLPVDGSVEFFGPQTISASGGTIAAINSMVCEDVSVVRFSEEAGITSDLAKSIVAYVQGQNQASSIRISADNYQGQAMQSATLDVDKKGMKAPAALAFDSSYIQANLQLKDVTKATRVFLYIRMSEKVAGLMFFMLRYNPNAPDGSRYVSYYTPRLISGDLYEIIYDIDADPANTGLIGFAIQQTTPTAPTIPFYVRFDSATFLQFYGYENGNKSFEQAAIEELINDATASLAAGEPITIKVSADPTDNDAAFTGPNAVQLAIDSITDNSPSKRYRIFVKEGIYKITNSSQFLGNIGYPAMVMMKPHVDVEGQSMDGTILWAELPYNDADIDTAVGRILHQTMWNMTGDNKVSNITLIAKNIRYVLHQDNPGTQYSTRHYENVNMQFIGDKGGLNVFGLGTWQGEKNYVDGGRAISSTGTPFACHTNTQFAERSVWSFKNFSFVKAAFGGSYNAIALQNAGSKVNDELRLEGCTFGGLADCIVMAELWLTNQGGADYYNHADFRVHGYRNAPFLFVNELAGASLRISTIAKGAGQVVRFAPGSSAFPLLIPEARLKQADIFVPSQGIVDGYIYQDGSPGLSGVAIGAKDLSYNAALYDAGIAYQAFGRRLGDCTTTPKTLGIIINGVTYNIVFNLNYTALPLSTILSQINTALAGVAVADMYGAGSLYYPTMTDVLELMYNDSSVNYIPKGTIVQRVEGNAVVPCTDPRNYYGVALDDIPVYNNAQGVIGGQGRILKRGFIDTALAPMFVRTTKQAVYGDRFTINNGVLNLDANGVIRTVRNGVVAINC